ncbi:MAG: urease accessory protein UreF [Deltaproteobacteria bacterium]|nr:urease accessory protein UreF [Deltaproteobacteria bacterium]
MNWLLLQLADSSFPAGAFAHSNGLEAALQHGELQGTGVAGFEKYLGELLWQTGHGALVLASQAHRRPEIIGELDALCEVFLSNHIANRASRVQGRTFLATCERSFSSEKIVALAAGIRGSGLHEHFAPVFGAALEALGVELPAMQRLLLHGTLRGVISAAIRLGVFGPYQAQRVQAAAGPTLDAVLAHCSGLAIDELAQTAPLIDLMQANHDQLYSRLFQS